MISPRAAAGALLCPGTSTAFGELETPHLQQIHLDGQYWCLLSLNEEEYVKSSYPQEGCKLWITLFSWYCWRCLKPSWPAHVANAASGSLTARVSASRDCRGLLGGCHCVILCHFLLHQPPNFIL